jgi:hypothetical protein
MVAIVLSGLDQVRKGLNVQPVKPLIAAGAWIVWPIWALMALGLAVALPAAISAGFLRNDAASSAGAAHRTAANAIAQTPTQGTLVAAPRMPVNSMILKSSIRVQRGSESELFSEAQYGGAGIFDYHIAGSAMTFRRCRYYYITTDAGRPPRIAIINVGISPEQLGRPALEAANRDVRRRLIADGWHRSGRRWIRSGTVLDLRSRRLDEPIAGENRANAGEWIAFIELREVKTTPQKVKESK